MITTLPFDGGKLVALSVRGKLTHEDYRDSLIPRLEKAIEQHGRLRVLCVLGEDYEGITPGAVWDELKFDVKHRRDFERVAIVTDDKLVRAGVTVARPFFSGEVRLFRVEDQARARQWVEEGLPEPASE